MAAGGGRCSDEGDDRNRTGVDGFAGRCVATPPRRQGSVRAYRALPRSGGAPSPRRGNSPVGPVDGLTRLFLGGYQQFGLPLAALWEDVSVRTASRRIMASPQRK